MGGNREKFLFLRVRIDVLGVEIKQVVIFLHFGLLNLSICEVLWSSLSYWLGRGSENVQRRVIFMVFSVPFFPTSNWKLGNWNVPRSLFSRGLTVKCYSTTRITRPRDKKTQANFASRELMSVPADGTPLDKGVSIFFIRQKDTYHSIWLSCTTWEKELKAQV